MASQNYNLGPKAVIAIKNFEKILARFPRVERLSMLRYLATSESAPTIAQKFTTGSLANLKTAIVKKSVGGKKVLWKQGSRVRTKDGTFASRKRAATSARI